MDIPIQSLWPAVKWLPGFLIRRHFTEQRLAALIHVDVRPRHSPVAINLGQGASYSIWLQVFNLSPFDVELDRATFEFRCGIGILKTSLLQRKRISPGQIAEIHVTDSIPADHADFLANTPASARYFAIDGHLEFNSQIRQFAKSTGHLSDIRPNIVNEICRTKDDSG